MANELNTPARIATEKFAEHDARLNALMTNAPDLVRVGFTNLVENGGFDTNTTGWTSANTSDFSVTSGNVSLQNDGTAYGFAYSPVDLALGRHYLLTAGLVSVSAGFGRADIYGAVASQMGTAGISEAGPDSYTLPFAPTSAVQHYLHFGNRNDTDAVSVWSGFSLWEADPADDAPWLRLPFGYRVLKGSDLHPLASVQRDADMLHGVDFTEIWRNGQCFVKPSTAPGVSTRFSVVAYKGI